MIYQPAPDPEFYFDAAAADRAVRFIQRFCTHWEGEHVGKPFTLLDWQCLYVRTLFGWKRRRDNRRRFIESWILSAKGGGKTPFMAAIGMYLFVADGEAGAHIISAAKDYPQASLTLDAGKKFVELNADLKKLCQPMQYAIRGPRHSKWTIVSGDPTGKHGFRPSGLLMDEAHEWPNGLLYDALTANTPKRAQPVTIVASNAADNRSGFAWKLHERAVAVMKGKADASRTLLPAIFEAPIKLAWDSEEAARAANPSIPHTIKFERLADEIQKARESKEAEAKYRRLFLSQWGKSGGGRWLDMDVYDRVVKPFNVSDRKNDLLYVGLDMSQGDDLCAAIYVWVTAKHFWVHPEFWMPKATADRYVKRVAVPYDEWAAAGHLHLIEEPTVSPDVQRRIAAQIVARSKTGTLKAICYDAMYASHAAAALEAAGLPIVPVRQGYTLDEGCTELDRRLIEKSITIQPNSVMRFCAENAELTTNSRGQVWPVKPHAKGKYAGKVSAKIDGIVALVTSLVEARKHDFAKKPAADWTKLIRPIGQNT